MDNHNILFAYVKHLSEQSKLVTPVTTACTAINFAFKVNDMDDTVMNMFPMKILRASIRSNRKKPVEKKTAISKTELSPCIDKWGFGRGPGERRQTALMMGMGAGLLARFSDLALIRCQGMLFFPEGVLFCLPRRKNM